MARISALIFSAVQLPLLVRLLPPSTYVYVAMAVVMASFAASLAGASIIVRFQRVPGSDSQRGSYFAARRHLLRAIILLIASSVLLGVIVQELLFALAVSAWAAGLAATQLSAVSWLMWERPWKYAQNVVVSGATRTTALLALLVGGASWEIAFMAAGALSAVAGRLAGPVAGKGSGGPALADRALGTALLIATLATAVNLSADRILLPLLATPSMAGSYAGIANLQVFSVGAALGICLTAGFPVARRLWDADMRSELRAAVRAIHGPIILGISLVLLLGPLYGSTMLTLVLGDAYGDWRIFVGLASSQVVFSLAQFYGWLHMLSGAGHVVRNAALASVTLNVLILIGGVPLMGVEVAVVASLVGNTAFALLIGKHAAAPRAYWWQQILLAVGGIVALTLSGALVILWACLMAITGMVECRHLRSLRVLM
jgi:O-antigen/teichoic acid export membrane protein